VKVEPPSEGRSYLEGGAYLTPQLIQDCYSSKKELHDEKFQISSDFVIRLLLAEG